MAVTEAEKVLEGLRGLLRYTDADVRIPADAAIALIEKWEKNLKDCSKAYLNTSMEIGQQKATIAERDAEIERLSNENRRFREWYRHICLEVTRYADDPCLSPTPTQEPEKG